MVKKSLQCISAVGPDRKLKGPIIIPIADTTGNCRNENIAERNSEDMRI